MMTKWVDIAHHRVNEIVATFVSGGMVANGVDDSWTLVDWSTVLGMVYVSSMLIPRLYEFGKWLMKKWENRNDGKAPKR